MIYIWSLARRARNGFAGSVNLGFLTLLLAAAAFISASLCSAVRGDVALLSAQVFVLFYPAILCFGFLIGFVRD